MDDAQLAELLFAFRTLYGRFSFYCLSLVQFILAIVYLHLFSCCFKGSRRFSLMFDYSKTHGTKRFSSTKSCWYFISFLTYYKCDSSYFSQQFLLGYQRELVYQRHDGSFSAFGNADDEGSLWWVSFQTEELSVLFLLW